METQAYKNWIEIFDDKILYSFECERKELKKASMLVTALDKEIKSIQQIYEEKISSLRKKLKQQDILEQNKDTETIKYNDKSGDITQLETNIPTKQFDLDSPDIFRNDSLDFQNLSTNSTYTDTDTSLIEENTSVESSPTLISKRKKKLRPKKSIDMKKNIFKNMNKENTKLVDSKEKNKESLCKKRQLKKTTLTQMFSDVSKNDKTLFKEPKSEKNQFADDTTYMEQSQDTLLRIIHGDNLESRDPKKEPDTNQMTEAEAFAEGDDFEMGITGLLGIINEVEDDEMNSTQEIDEFSKAVLFDEESPLTTTRSPQKKFKADASFVEPKVRGHAKKLLKGFACAQCRDFYAGMNLSPEELQKKMDECSKHRFKYRPPEDTFPDVWNMTISQEKKPIKSENKQ